MIHKCILTFIIVLLTILFACQSRELQLQEKGIDEEDKSEDEIYTILDLEGSWKFILYHNGWGSKLINQNEVLVIKQDSSYQYFANDTLQREGKVNFDYYITYSGDSLTNLQFENWDHDFLTHLKNEQKKTYLTLSEIYEDCGNFSFVRLE